MTVANLPRPLRQRTRPPGPACLNMDRRRSDLHLSAITDMVESEGGYHAERSRRCCVPAEPIRPPHVRRALNNEHRQCAAAFRGLTSCQWWVHRGAAIFSLMTGYAVSSASLLALASHSTLYPLTMVIPLVSLTGKAKTATAAFVTSFAGVSLASYLFLGSNWPKQTWGTMYVGPLGRISSI